MSRRAIALCFASAIILIPAAYGFIRKFIEFVRTFGTDDGGFIIVPMLNYLCVAAGFTCLLVWAVFHGMFNDIEKPKYTMLEREAELDRQEGRAWSE